MAEWSLPEEAWLEPGPEPALRRNDRNLNKVPDISVAVHLLKAEAFLCFFPPTASMFLGQIIRTGLNRLAVFVSANVVVLSC